MTEHTCQIVCECNENTLNEIIHQWWKEVEYSKKELLDDSLPKRFFGNFRIGHYRGEDRIHFEFKIIKKAQLTILKVYMLYPEFSPLLPSDTFQEIVCWFISALKEKNISAEIKQGLLSRKIICP
ncbi:MAG: hypothetical protein KAJ51_13790 [Thermoplasmata archaeon]|nr:hypothetical protein [Thermoplasmata archaeon]